MPPAESRADVLSDVLAICRSEHAVTARFALSAPWGLASEGTPGALLRMARGAPYWMQVADQPAQRVDAGDLVMVLPGVRHRIVSSQEVQATPFRDLIRRHACGTPGENPLVFSHGEATSESHALTDLFSTHIWFSAYCRHTVFHILPPTIHIRAQDMGIASVLATTMQALIEESLARRPGWRLSGSRMGELLLVNILREHLAKSPAASAGWLRGITDPAIARSIACMHRSPRQEWNLTTLAQEAAMSRTRFSARFKELVGSSPIEYLTAHRMALAAEALESDSLHLSEIADQAGYASEKVFSRAFRRWSGMTPSAFQKRESRRRHDAMAQARL
ncbi:MAG: AraC family transcriptional regulator [Burkholderiaceae bacterium]